MKKILITILITTIHSVYSQSDSVKFEILESAKLHLITEFGLIKNIESLKKEIDTTFKCEFLESKGFDNSAYFIRLSKRPAISNWHDTMFMKNNVYGSCEYVYCYYNKTHLFYKLKGFIDNNVVLLFQHFSYLSHIDLFAIILWSKDRERLKFNLKRGDISLSRIDILCLFDYWSNFLSGKKINNDCLNSCKLQDLELGTFIPTNIYKLPKNRL